MSQVDTLLTRRVINVAPGLGEHHSAALVHDLGDTEQGFVYGGDRYADSSTPPLIGVTGESLLALIGYETSIRQPVVGVGVNTRGGHRLHHVITDH